jgi:hypothetical protein
MLSDASSTIVKKLYFSKLFLKAKFEKLLNTKLAPNFKLNISK